MNKTPHLKVAVSLRTGLAYAAEILRGIADYARQKGHWTLEVDSAFHFGHRPARIDRHWRGDGAILIGGDAQVLDAIVSRRDRLPVVNATGWSRRFADVPHVFWDDRQIAVLGAEHLLQLGLERFAYFGPVAFPPSRDRAAHFKALVAEHGHPCALCEWSPAEVRENLILGRREWWQAARFFKHQLAVLEPPLGILANNDITASLLIAAAAEIGLRCPQDIAVVGAWNDPVICESTHPPLTSIEADFFRIGHEAATLLDRMMREPGFRPPARTRIASKGLVRRESTDYLGFEDELVARAVRFIRRTAPTRPLTVREVLRTVPMSRSSFGARFRDALGRSAKAEILRVRLEHVQRLLQKTNWSITRIAGQTGFESSRDLARLFRIKTGQTPSAYRQAAK